MNFGRYITNTTSLQFFQLIRFGSLFIIGIIFTKIPLEKGVIGIYESFLFIAAAVSTFWISGLVQSFLSLFNSSRAFGKKEGKTPVIFNTFILFVFFSALFSALLLIFKSYLLQIFTETQDFRYFDLLIIYILLANPGYMIEFIYLVKNRPKNILVYGLLFFFLQIIAAGLPPVFGYDIIYSIYGLISLSVIRLIWLGVLIFRHSIIRISFPYLREHISVGYPLIISVLLSGSAQYVDGYLVSQYYSREVFAVFRYGARELPFVVLMANALSNSMLPEMSLKNGFSGALASIKRKSLRLMHFVFPAAIIIMFFSHWLFPIIYNEGFRESATIFNIYLLLTISYMVFPQTVLIGLKRTRTIMLTSFIELVINVALSILLIRYLNIAGVALATVIAYYSEKAILIIFNSAYKIRPASYIPLGWLLFYSVITLAVYVLIEYKPLNLL